jgi:hypothetical protein
MPPKKKIKVSPYFSSNVNLSINAKENEKSNANEKPKQDTCTICLDHMQDEAAIACVHRFCFRCIKAWADVTNLCPLCKKKFSSIRKLNVQKQEVVVVEDKAQTVEHDDEALARNLANEETAHDHHGYESDGGFVVPDTVIDYAEYDDGLPDEEDSFVYDESYGTGESESFDFTPIGRRLPRRSFRRNRSQRAARRVDEQDPFCDSTSSFRINSNTINLLSPDEDSQSNGAEASDKAAIDLVTPRRNNIDTQSFEAGNSGMIFTNFHRPNNWISTPVVLDQDNTGVEEESPYF